MADNISQSQHITELDFDISRIYNQMNEIENVLISEGKKLNDIIKGNWKIGDVLNSDSSINKQANQAMEQKKIYNELSKKVTDLQKLKEDFNKKNISAIDFEIKKQEILGKTKAQQIKSQMTAQAEAEKLNNTYANKTYATNEKAYSLSKKMSTAKGTQAKTERTKLETLKDQSDELVKQLQLNGKLTDEQKEQLNIMEKELQASQNNITKISSATGSKYTMLDRAKSYASYGAYSFGLNTAKTAATTIKDIEYSVMEISRVMQLGKEETLAFKQQLFDLSSEYAREFEDVTEVSLRYAQAGYNQNEVIEMTKSSLLALNTAELDVANSTNSMIGILQQWGMQANELQGTLDKLNYTADNNAITTQDLVDGLLRASGAAKNAKMSFDDTIGTLTAMKEASGRTGKEVGNALNSIIAYVQRTKSLNVFEGLGIQVYTDETRENFVPILNMLGQLSDKVKTDGDVVIDTLMKQTELTELYSEDLAIAAGAEEEYSKAIEAENKATKQGLNDVERKSALELAGMHRRNYFIALLNNFNKVQEVSTSLINADGYSMKENSKHMETLQAKYNQLITSLKELAVQFADAGAMDIAKDIIDATTAINGFIGKTGGLENVLRLVLGVLILIKREKISKQILSIKDCLARVIPQIKIFVTSLHTTATAEKSVATSATAAGTALNGMLGIVGLAITAFSLISGAISAHNQKLEEAKQKALENAQAQKEEYDQLQGLISSYEELGKKTDLTVTEKDQLKTIQEQLNGLYEDEKTNIDLVNGSYQTQIDKLKELSKEKARDTLFSQYSVTDTAVDDYKTTTNEDFAFVDPTVVSEELYEEYAETLSGIEKLNYDKYVDTAKGFIYSLKFDEDTTSAEAYNAVGKALDNLNEKGITSGKVWDKLLGLKSHYDTETQSVITELQKEIELLEVTGLNNEKLTEDKKLLAQAQEVLGSKTNDLTTAQDENSDSGDNNENSTTDLAKAKEDLATAYENLDKQISSNSSNISGLNKILEDVNKGQVLSADQILNLVDNYGLLSRQVTEVEGGYRVELSTLEDLRQAKIKEAETAENAQIQATISAIQETVKRTNSYYDEISAIKDLATAQEALANIENDERIKASHINSGSQAKEYLEYVNKNKDAKQAVTDIVNLLENKELRISSLYENLGKSVSKGVSGVKDEIEDTRDTLSDMTKTYEHLNSMGVYTLEEQIEYFEKLRRTADLTADELMSVEKSLQGLYKKQIEEKIDLIEKEKDAKLDAINDTYDEEIDRLNDLKDARNEDRDTEDYFEKRAELQEELSGYRQRTGTEARENEKKILKEIANLDKDWRRQQEDDTIDEQIKSAEKRKDEELEIVENKYNEIMNMFTDTNRDLLATAGVFAPELYNQFEKYFTNPFEADLNRLKSMIRSLDRAKVSASSGIGRISTSSSRPTSNSNSSSQPTSSKTKTVGDKVKILSSAQNYGGQSSNVKIPENKKNTSYTVSQIGYGGTQALIKELYSWVNLSDLVKAKTGGKALEDGAIFMRKDEFVVRPDLTKWLEKQASQDNSITNNSNSKTVINNFNKPLYSVEKQEITDKTDADIISNKVTRKIVKKIQTKL